MGVATMERRSFLKQLFTLAVASYLPLRLFINQPETLEKVEYMDATEDCVGINRQTLEEARQVMLDSLNEPPQEPYLIVNPKTYAQMKKQIVGGRYGGTKVIEDNWVPKDKIFKVQA